MRTSKYRRMKDLKDISLYIIDYLTGQISDEGKELLAQWVQESDVNRREFTRMREAWMGASIIERNYDGEVAFLRFKKHVMNRSNVTKSTWFIRNKANIHSVMSWAAAILLPILLTCTVVMYYNITNLHDGQMVASTAAGETSTIQLPDGTQVMLKESSQISYSSADFTRGKRNIEFQGAGYFYVASDASHPFTITTEKEQVRVLGTEFYLVSEKGSQKDVLSLDKGKVDFTDNKTGQVVHMQTGDELVYNTITGNTYCRARTEEEVKLAQENYRNTAVSRAVYAELEKIATDKEGICNIQLNVSKALKPGLYQVRVNPTRDMASFQPTENAERFSGGEGTIEHPYLISNARQMCNMKSALTPYKMTYFALTSDIDLQGIEWIPLNDKADEYSLWVTLDGRGHVIRNLTTTRSCYFGSFFGVLCGVCRNVGFENVNIYCNGYGAGAIAGYLGHSAYTQASVVEDCYATGRVCGQSYAGGLIGNIGSKSVLNRCYSDVDVSSISSYAGGLIGKVRAPFVMEGCYSTGNVTGQYAGGIVAGGQKKGTPHSRIHDVTAINRSVNGSRQSYAVMPIIDGDTLSHVAHSSNIYLNGKRMNQGLSEKEVKERLNTLRHTWYGSKVTLPAE